MIHVSIVDMDGSELLSFDANSEQTIIEQMEDKAFDMPYSCRAGACMTCAVVVKDHNKALAEEITPMDLIEQQHAGEKFIETDEEQILTCIAGFTKKYVESPDTYNLVLEMIDFY